MKYGLKIAAALALAFAGIMGTAATVNHVAATTAIQCGCGNQACHGGCRLARRSSTCGTCNTQCGCVECPQCECNICTLELDHSKVKKTCFKVEQKVVCIPPVRFPWMKCCPPGTSKTRTVNTLKTHSYECPGCAYKWTLLKPENIETTTREAPITQSVQPPAGAVPIVTAPTPQPPQIGN